MESKRSRVTYLLVAATLCLVAWAASAMPRLRATPQTLPHTDPPAVQKGPNLVTQVPKARPHIEVVFALDTTGSMTGLIDGAKRKIWSIASFIAQGNPTPDLRIGLVAYRDKGDEYVTRFYDLSGDLDTVFEHLSSFEAAGGGDTPEHVSKALYDAVNRASWTADQSTLKQIYLVGDAPPHTDYHDGFDYLKIAREANQRGIHINTIRCGSDPATAAAWNQIAHAADGAYASIDQSGGMMAVATPYDTQLAQLNAKLVGTAIGYGRWRGEVASKRAAAEAMPAPAAADRAAFYGATGGSDGLGGLPGMDALGGEGDLVRAVAEGKAKAEAMPAAALPPEMAAMDGSHRAAYVAKKGAERKQIADEINALAKKRKDYLATKGGHDGFDAEVNKTIKAQAASIGVRY